MAESRDPGGRITLFSVLSLAGAVFGVATGYALGARFGWPVAILAGVAGLIIGCIPGQLLGNYGIMLLVRKLNKEDTPTLREKLKHEYYISHLIMIILLGRGEPRGDLARDTLQMLFARERETRWQAWRTLNLNFPEVGEKLEGIDPLGEPEKYRDRVESVMAEIGKLP